MSDEKQPVADKYQMLDCGHHDHILRLLEPLKNTPSGNLVYKHIDHALRDFQRNQNKMTYGFAVLFHTLMNAYRKQLPKNSLLYLEIEMVQRRLMPPISLTELTALYNYVVKVLPLIQRVTTPDEDAIRDALSPLLLDAGENAASGDVSTHSTSVAEQRASHLSTPSVELHLDSVLRQRLNRHYNEILELQANMAEKIDQAAKQQQRFAFELESILSLLKKPESMTDIESIRLQLANSINKQITHLNNNNHILRDTQSYLHLVGHNCKKLSDELNQVRVLSLTDDLTGLPNRRAFVRRVGDEIVRSDRDKSAMTLIMMDIDNFKSFNDQYGHPVGDEILRSYASEILTVFRRYDMVSRYGGEEFGVLLPNTGREGAERALEKIQTKAQETLYSNGKQQMQVPTFSAGVAVHVPGETTEDLIGRADRALYRAKEQGRNRFVIDELPQNLQTKESQL